MMVSSNCCSIMNSVDIVNVMVRLILLTWIKRTYELLPSLGGHHMQNIIFDFFAWLGLTSLPTPYG